jgi:hypothetical protein
MRIGCILTFALAAGLATAAHAQLPYPFPPQPDMFGRPQCTGDYLRSVGKQAKALERLRTAGPDTIGRLCHLIERGSTWLGGKLTEEGREELRRFLGADVDLELLGLQCRAGQDAVDQELSAILRRLRSELVRCDDTI